MKKVFYTILLVVTLTLSFASCTEEGVAPKTNDQSSGGGTTDPKS
jgi:hypothetical protein